MTIKRPEAADESNVPPCRVGRWNAGSGASSRRLGDDGGGATATDS